MNIAHQYALIEDVTHNEDDAVVHVQRDGVIICPNMDFREAGIYILSNMSSEDIIQERYLSTGEETRWMTREEYLKDSQLGDYLRQLTN